MPHSSSPLLLVFALSTAHLACSASDPGTGSTAGGGAGNHAGSAGAASQAGAGGAITASGGTVGTGTGGSSGATQSGAGTGGTSGTAGGATSSGGTSGAGGAVGTAGTGGASAATCTPGTGTQPVGTASELDQKTCLTWTKTRSTATLTNKQAYKYCNDLTQDGITDWRVPSPEELVTWPRLTTDSTAYITGPIYIPNDAASVMDGCTGDSHSCNIAKYNDTSVTCGWQGVGFTGWVACVSGTATAGTTNAAYAAASCSPCNGELASFKVTDCSAYAN